MAFFLVLINGIVEFCRRNTLLVVIVLALAIGAPALFKGILLFALYFAGSIALLIAIGIFLLRRKLIRLQREAQEGGFSQGFGSNERAQGARRGQEQQKEGDVHIYRTSEAPEKRVAKGVGDYVDFEEEK